MGMQQTSTKPMASKQAGFTLIELVAVIVILGILAATAVPRFVNLQDEAAQAAVNGVAGSIESASALNHAVAVAVAAGLTTAATDPFFQVDNCSDGGGLLQGGALPADYTITAAVVSGTQSCSLAHTTGATASFMLIEVDESTGTDITN